MESLRKIKIFISCPNEIVKEGTIIETVEKTIGEDNVYFQPYKIEFDTSHWKKDIYLGKGEPRVQDTINKKLIENCYIYLCILWTEFGSSLGRTPEGKEYSSGTEEEFYYAEKLNKKIWVIFCNKPKNPFEINPQQLEKVQKFRETIKSKQIWYGEFKNEDELRRILKENLSNFINEKYLLHLEEKSIGGKPLPDKLDFSKYNRGF